MSLPFVALNKPQAGSPFPLPALLFSATLWGSSWFPFRLLETQGVAGLWAVMLTQAIAAVICLIYFRHALRALRWTVPMLAIGFFGGICNTSMVLSA